MPIFTYRANSSFRHTAHPEIVPLLAKLRERTGLNIVVEERVFDKRTWFLRVQRVRRYSVFVEMESGEYQHLSFYRDREEDGYLSLGLQATSEIVVAFFHGWLNGLSNKP